MNLPLDANFKAPRPRSPAPRIDPVFLWPTPEEADFLFYVEKNGDLPVNKTWEYGSAYFDPLKYPDHKLVYVAPQTEDKWSRWFYAAERVREDEYNWEFTQADIGGAKFDSVRRTYVTLRESFTPLLPAMGSTMANTPEDKFSGTYVLAEKAQQRIGDKELDSLFVIETRTYVKKTTLIANDFDEAFGGMLQTSQTLYYLGEVVTGVQTIEALMADPTDVYWGLQSSGVVREGRQLTANWYLVTSRAVVPEPFATSGRTYDTTEDYFWPAVLSTINVQSWQRQDGGFQRYLEPVYSKEAYRGPCKAQVVETFDVNPPTVTEPNVMRPLPISIQTPYFGVSIGPTLHDDYTLSFTNGTTDPIFVYTVASYPIGATSPVDWPASILASDTVTPLRGGYLRRQITVYPPTYTP